MTDQPGERSIRSSDEVDEHDQEHEHSADESSPLGDASGAPGPAESRPGGPDYAGSPLDDGEPGSQGDIEAGSEGDFGDPRVPAS